MKQDKSQQSHVETLTESNEEQNSIFYYRIKSYVPEHLVEALLKKPEGYIPGPRYLLYTLMSVDISGFTALTEEFSMSKKKDGAEILTGLINQLFTGIIKFIEKYRGSVLKFGGDSLLAMFPVDNSLSNISQQNAVKAGIAVLNFIKKNGSGIFNNLVLIEYLVNSDNAKKLDNKEKELLKKLLLLYRNIKFFPESMPDDNGESWEIIPVSKKEENFVKDRVAFAPIKSVKEKKQEEESRVNDLLAKQSLLDVNKEIHSQQSENKEILIKGDGFFFSPDDEEEIRELAKKSGNYSNSDLIDEVLLSQIISKVNINFSSEVLAERFKQFLKTYLAGIRNRIETKQAMIKPFEVGGLSFDEESAEQVLFIVDDSLENHSKRTVALELKKETINRLKDVGARDFEYDLATLVKQKKEKEEINKEEINKNILKKQELKKIDTAHELAPLTQAIIKAVKPILKPEISRKNINQQSTQIKRPRTEPDNKVKMEDVKFAPRVMGPIDELRYLNLVNFRRLNSKQGNAIEKIKEKINLLEEEESYAKRLEGIKAWRSCPVSKLYLDMGHNGISANKPIDVIIEERKKTGKDYLTVSEFEAILDLNKSLRF